MLTAFARAFRAPDLRNKLLFTLAVFVLFRLGSTIPAPGVNYDHVKARLKQASRARPSSRSTRYLTVALGRA